MALYSYIAIEPLTAYVLALFKIVQCIKMDPGQSLLDETLRGELMYMYSVAVFVSLTYYFKPSG